MARSITILSVTLMLALATPALADHSGDVHSDNMSLVATFTDNGAYQQGSDIAFWGDYAVAGNLNPGGFRLLDISDPARPREVSQFACPGSQSDVSIWRDLVFVSVDASRAGPNCSDGGATNQQFMQGQAWEGIRIVSIANPEDPAYLASVDTDCGSHTHTILPDEANDRVLIYVLSYPLGAPGVECSVVTHRKISVIEVPLDDPASAEVVSTPNVSPAIGCHDVTVYPALKRAAAACLTESQIWDITDPVNPTIVSHIVNPLINLHHSAAFSNDGSTLVIGDELGGAAAAAGCATDGNAPLGALWFYDVSNPAMPTPRGYFVIPGTSLSLVCTAHNFNVLPLREDRDVLVTAWYTGGTALVDFTDPANPEMIARYLPLDGIAGESWSSYWYNGYVYANNLGGRGIDVFAVDDAIVASAVQTPYLNAQMQEPLPKAAPASKPQPKPAKVKGTRQTLPATGAAAGTTAAGALVLLAALLGWWTRASDRTPIRTR